MNKVTFAYKNTDWGTYQVYEVGTKRKVAERQLLSGAAAHVDYMNAEHRSGRVAQSICALGHACDRFRITLPECFADDDAVVLCPEHKSDLDSKRARRRAA